MVKVLYIGDFSEGSTSRMRGKIIEHTVSAANFSVADTSVPLRNTNRYFRSLGWRFKVGPLIKNINRFVEPYMRDTFDLVWIDKGVFIRPTFLKQLRSKAKVLVHFTPDPAFTFHQSNLFYGQLKYYDYCVTTKSFELEDYKKQGVANVLYATQGFDPGIHKPHHTFEEKEGMVLIGHYEKYRGDIVKLLIERNIPVKIAGLYWKPFVKQHRRNKSLTYLGDGIFGDEYARTISGSLLGLGCLSKIIPEQHTTRTFEIPACGTALITEHNAETSQFFADDEVVFFNHIHEIPDKVEALLKEPRLLKDISERGYQKVTNGPYSYEKIVNGILNTIVR